MKLLSSILFENLTKTAFTADVADFDALLKKADEINDTKTEISSIFKQQNILQIKDDSIMQIYFEIADIIDAFCKVSDFYYEERNKKISWLDQQIIKNLKAIKKYNDQLASVISINHANTEVEISLTSSIFENNKSLATFIKQSDEWKQLKKLLKTDLTLKNQSLTIRGIGFSIITKTKSFIKIIT